jgi:hypothetical protein
MDTMRLVSLTVLGVVLLLGPGTAHAQDVGSFDDLPRVLELGQRVIVREDDGTVSRGKVMRLDDNRLEIRWRRWILGHGERTLTSATIETIKVRDSDWNGTLLGAGAGALAGWLFVDRRCDRDFCISPVGRVLGSEVGATVGMLIDQSINATVYESSRANRVRFAPMVSPHRVGLLARAAF